ncbi:MAG: OmpH family outer membrane protein [Flavobacterium sp.]|nr:MAG: OmpH family outer membrane protein [Flavobacterium sp.]
MKKVIVLAVLGLSMIACNKETSVKQAKTAYVDTAKLVDQATEAKDIEAKYKDIGARLDQDIARFQQDAANFEKSAQTNGMAWAQQNAPALQQRKMKITQDQQDIRKQSGVEMDTMISKMKKLIKDYGKEKGYDYIYEASAVLYTDEKNDITKDVIKLVNDKYKSGEKKEEAAAPAEKK